MDEDIMNGLNNFNRVWSRITGETEVTAVPYNNDVEILKRFIADESNDEAFYMALARNAGRAARTLRCIAADKRGHKSALQVEYFLLTGDSYVVSPSCPAVGAILDSMRMAYSGELDGAEQYKAAAESTKSERLSELYRLHASDERNHAEMIRCTILRIIG